MLFDFAATAAVLLLGVWLQTCDGLCRFCQLSRVDTCGSLGRSGQQPSSLGCLYVVSVVPMVSTTHDVRAAEDKINDAEVKTECVVRLSCHVL